jgi:PEP-CTERM motif
MSVMIVQLRRGMIVAYSLFPRLHAYWERLETIMRKLTASVLFEATRWTALGAALSLLALPASAAPFFFSTGNVTNLIATASRPENGAKFEIESADDFVTTGSQTRLTGATFTGLLTGGATLANIGEVRVEIYRVFPNDSNVGRTSGPPTFSTSQVPTRVNSPSDVALDDRDSNAGGGLTFSASILNATFTALNSIQAGGIHPVPVQTTGGNGPVTGTEVLFTITFTDPFELPADHYFFIPQVDVTLAGGQFLWLSGTRPIVPPGTPFAPDLQSWTRDSFLDPDWLRVGTDIVGAGTFNAAFTLTGAVPEPGTALLVGAGAIALWWRRRRSA